jgi:hypothetical protein
MKFSEQYPTLVEAVTDLLRGLRNRLTFKENLQAVEISVADTGAANTQFTVRHALGKIPRLYLYNIDRAGIVYDSARNTWTNQELYLKCSVANAAVVLTIT